jgi:hypothetical protein
MCVSMYTGKQYRHIYNNITPLLTFFIQKVIKVQLFKKFTVLSESAGIKSNTSIDILFGRISTFLCFTSYFSVIQFRYDNILPSMTRFCKCSLLFRFTDKIVLCIHISLHVIMGDTCYEYLLFLDQNNKPGVSDKG